jgi:hypothetical protein
LVGVVFAGEDFAAGEKLIFVWRLGALDRLRAILGRISRGEGEFGSFHSMRRCAVVTPELRAKLAGGYTCDGILQCKSRSKTKLPRAKR